MTLHAIKSQQDNPCTDLFKQSGLCASSGIQSTYQSAAELSFLWMSFPLNGLSITRCCMVMLLKCPPSNLLYTSGVEQTILHKRVFCCCKAWPWKEANRNPRRYRYLSRQGMYPMGGETSAGEDSRMRLGKEFRAVSGSSKVQAWGAKAERDGRW